MKHVIVFTDGSCLGNPGPGGSCAVLRFGESEKILTKGYRLTTNNRMEMRAVIDALEALIEPCRVDLTTDSQYVRNAITKGWLKGWQKNGWRTADKKPVKNQDLWRRFIPLLAKHQVTFHWTRGHAGHADNELCDRLARQAASGSTGSLAADEGFVAGA